MSLFDPQAFRAELDALMRRNPDPALHDACWSYIEGRTTRQELRRVPAYTEAARAFYLERFAELEAAGVLAAVRAEVRRVVEQQDAADGTDVAGQVLTRE